jgi:hypothetical protein
MRSSKACAANSLAARSRASRRRAPRRLRCGLTPYIPLGQWYGLVAARKTVHGLLATPTIVFWNISKR